MGTHRSNWKRRERDGAELFGARRQPGSGSSGRSDQTRSDSTHERLYIETKLRAASSVRSLWERTREQARREGKTPVLVLYAKGKPGGLIVAHQDNVAAVAAELAQPGADGTGIWHRGEGQILSPPSRPNSTPMAPAGPTDPHGPIRPGCDDQTV